jgi:hypothetical protein
VGSSVKVSSFFKVKFTFPLIVAAVALLFLALPEQALAQVDPDCNAENGDGTFDNDQLDGAGNACVRTPDFYGIQMYEMHLCRSAPTPPTTTATIVLPGCDIILASSSGELIEVQLGQSTTIPGTATRPSPGVYTHGYILMGNGFRIRHSQQMESVTSAEDLSTTGVFCWTLTKSLATGSVGDASKCRATAPTEAEIGTTTDVLENFGTGVYTFNAPPVTAYIIKASGFLLAAGEDVQAVRLVGLQTFATPVTVTETSRRLDMAFNVSTGMTVSFNNTDDLEAFQSGPFSVLMTVE